MDKSELTQKNPCPDCTFCQYCSNTRCAICRQPACKKTKKDKVIKIHKPLFRTY